MQNIQLVDRVSIRALLVIPGICAVINLGFLLLPLEMRRAQISDYTQQTTSVVSIVLSWLCLIAALSRGNWKRTSDAPAETPVVKPSDSQHLVQPTTRSRTTQTRLLHHSV
jgi:hypothetical protein